MPVSVPAPKPYSHIPIQDCGEPLVAIPRDQFAVVQPHPYQALGAPYGVRSPYWLRSGVLTQLHQAKLHLQRQYPGWQLQIFDAYRPVAVQRFMVDYTFRQLATHQGLDPQHLTPDQRQQLWQQVNQFWATPSLDPATPPPHSTGAAVDLTLINEAGYPVDMGSPIDEPSPRSYPDHFAHSPEPTEQQAHQHRHLLHQVMTTAGFVRHPNEWWHFSLGDQLWAWQTQPDRSPVARYGGVDEA
jgi:D-alanyl-D-alanine dipeptidase